MNLLCTLIVIVGTRADIKRSAPDLAYEFGCRKVIAIQDERAHERFPGTTGPMYNARWSDRLMQLAKIRRRLPEAVIVLGRETVPAFNPQIGCTHGNILTCRPDDLEECVQNVRDAACSL